ncbi:MAG: DUF58 domain-containing protein [Halobacteriota archaeon]|jgi:uncharacterized protein (DUF58 family)
MKIKQRTYALLALAGLLVFLGAILDLWFYTIGALGVGLYVAARLLSFRSTVHQLDLDIQREAIYEAGEKDVRVAVCVSLCANLNVGGSFIDLIPDDFARAGPVEPPQLLLSRGEHAKVRYRLVAARDVGLTINRSAFSFENDLFTHTMYFATSPAATKRRRSGAVGGPASGDRQSGSARTDAPGYGTRAGPQTGTGFELSHVRPYASTDPRNRIDWKTSAKLDELMTKVFFAEIDDSGIGFGAPITVVVDQSGGLDGAAAGQIARDFSAQIVEYVARFASNNESLMSVMTYDKESVAPLALGETPSHVSRWVSSLERSRPEPRLRTPTRTKSGITSVEVQRFEELFSRKDARDGARFREVISYLYARKEGYLQELQRSSAYQAIAHSVEPPRQRSALIVVSDLDSDVDPLIEGIRVAAYAGTRVYLISFFSKLFQRFQDAFIALEDLYDDYERYQVRLGKVVASAPEAKVIEAPSADYLTFLEHAEVT